MISTGNVPQSSGAQARLFSDVLWSAVAMFPAVLTKETAHSVCLGYSDLTRNIKGNKSKSSVECLW